MSALLSPVFGAGVQLFTNAGLPLNGGKIYTYLAGSLTPADTWNDPTQAVKNSNPIILDAYGRSNVMIFLANGVAYKFIVHDALDQPVGISYDNVSGVPIIVTQTITQYNALGLTPTYISGASFSVVGNQTGVLPVGLRVQATVAAGTAYGTIGTSVFSGGVTTVTLAMDSTSLDVGLSAIFISFITPVGRPIDAYSVAYEDTLQYPAGTVGGGLQSVGWMAEFPPSPTFISTTQFSLVGNFSSAFLVGRRVRYTLSSGKFYGTISDTSFNGTITTITLVPDGFTVVDNTITAAAVGGMSLDTTQLDAGQIKFTTGLGYEAGSVGSQFSVVAGLPPASITTGTPVVTDAGKCIYATGGVSIPNGVFTLAQVLPIINTTGAPITITAGISTLRQAGTANTGNRTLAGYGIATVCFQSGTLAIISGQGLT